MQTAKFPQKVVSVLLSLALVLSFTPSLAFADEVDTGSASTESKQEADDRANSNNVTSGSSESDGNDEAATNNNVQPGNSGSEQNGSRSGDSNASASSDTQDTQQNSAQEESLTSENEANDQANSWRFVDGEQIYSYEGASTEAVDPYAITPFAAAPGAASYATWYKSNGMTSYTYKANPNDAGKTINVSGAKRVGIDVSYHNGTIDWSKVKNSGVSFAIIRCGYGSDFRSQDDTQFINNIRGAQVNGIDIGIYLYSYAKNTTGNDSSASSEAQHVLRLLREAGLEPNELAYPIFYDMEENSQANLGAKKLGQLASTFCSAISDAGYEVGIYANQNWWRNYLTDSVFSNSDWHKWVARYPGSNQATDSGVSGTEIWQFSDCGHVDGISGNVDMNFDYVGSYGISYGPKGEWTTKGNSEYYYVDGKPHTGWLVNNTRGDGVQRYWFNSDGTLAKNRLITAEEAGYYAYATAEGYVVRGKYTAPNGSIYLANNDGKLENPGWIITSSYDGRMQRYRIGSDFACETGFFEVDGSHYHGNTVTGYVVRGKIAYDNSFMLANNDGVLQGPGWVVSNAYDGKTQRYYIDDNGHFTAKTGFFEVDGSHYHGNTVTGYVVRGKARYGNGMLLADNDGKLAWEEGWLVTDKYDGTLQRYRIDNSCDGYMGAHIGKFAIDGKSYYGREDTGYVVRGLYRAPSGQFFYGNNDGVLNLD